MGLINHLFKKQQLILTDCSRKVQTNSERPAVKEMEETSHSQISSRLTSVLPLELHGLNNKSFLNLKNPLQLLKGSLRKKLSRLSFNQDSQVRDSRWQPILSAGGAVIGRSP